MLRIEEYHFTGLDPLQWAKMIGLTLLWILLFVTAHQLTMLHGIAMVLGISLFTAMAWRSIVSSTRAGSWLTSSHFHIYYGDKHWSFPLARIVSVSGRSGPFSVEAPNLELTGGRRVRLPITALPPARDLQDWFANSAIRVDALPTVA